MLCQQKVFDPTFLPKLTGYDKDVLVSIIPHIESLYGKFLLDIDLDEKEPCIPISTIPLTPTDLSPLNSSRMSYNQLKLLLLDFCKIHDICLDFLHFVISLGVACAPGYSLKLTKRIQLKFLSTLKRLLESNLKKIKRKWMKCVIKLPFSPNIANLPFSQIFADISIYLPAHVRSLFLPSMCFVPSSPLIHRVSNNDIGHLDTFDFDVAANTCFCQHIPKKYKAFPAHPHLITTDLNFLLLYNELKTLHKVCSFGANYRLQQENITLPMIVKELRRVVSLTCNKFDLPAGCLN